MRTRLWALLTGLGLFLLCTGCASQHRRAEIPLGEWSGEGVFLLEKWSVDQNSEEPSRIALDHGSYPTHLKIERAPVGEEETIRLEILSERGETQELDGDRTCLVAHLKPTKSIADGEITLYRLVQFAVSLDEEAPSLSDGPEGLTHATCMAVDGDIVLRIHYMEGFVDTFRFRGDRLFKDGSFFPETADGLIHWSERLERQP